MGRPPDEIIAELEAERDKIKEALLPFALHAKALGLPKRTDTLTVITEKFSSHLIIGAFRTALEMFPELADTEGKKPKKSRYGWSSDPTTDAELQAKYGDSAHKPKGQD